MKQRKHLPPKRGGGGGWWRFLFHITTVLVPGIAQSRNALYQVQDIQSNTIAIYKTDRVSPPPPTAASHLLPVTYHPLLPH